MSSAKEHFHEMRTRILEYGNRWDAYFEAVAHAYSQAYKSQQELLSGMKETLAAIKKQENREKHFVVAFLAHVYGGPLGQTFARGVSEDYKVLSDAASDFLGSQGGKIEFTGKKTVEKLTDEVVKNWAAKITKAMTSPVRAGSFEPAFDTPEDYAAALKIGAKNRTILMSDLAFKWWEKADTFSPDRAKMMVDQQKQAYFFTHAPLVLDDKSKDTLRNKAKLLLWIRWGWERDRNYWMKDSGIIESFAWEPVRLEFLRIGVPFLVTTTYGSSNPYDLSARPRLNFPAFIDWCHSEASLLQLISGAPIANDLETLNQMRHEWRVNLASHALRR